MKVNNLLTSFQGWEGAGLRWGWELIHNLMVVWKGQFILISWEIHDDHNYVSENVLKYSLHSKQDLLFSCPWLNFLPRNLETIPAESSCDEQMS